MGSHHRRHSLLLGVHGGKSTVTASGLRVLTTHTDAPVVTKTTVEANTLHTLNVLTESLIQEVGIFLGSLAVLVVTVPVQHPGRDLELQRVAHHSHELVQVDVALLANDVGDTTTHTTDGGQSIHHLLAAVHVGIAHTQDVLEVLRLELHRHVCGNTGLRCELSLGCSA